VWQPNLLRGSPSLQIPQRTGVSESFPAFHHALHEAFRDAFDDAFDDRHLMPIDEGQSDNALPVKQLTHHKHNSRK